MNPDFDKIEIQEELPDHHYRTEIPNFIFQAGLSVYDLAVYAFIKYRAGDDKKCWETVPNICKELGIGATKLREAIDNLKEGKNKFNIPLINKQPRKKPDGSNDSCLLTIINVWGFNGKICNKNKNKGTSPNEGGVPRQTRGGTSPREHKQDPSEQDQLLCSVKGAENAPVVHNFLDLPTSVQKTHPNGENINCTYQEFLQFCIANRKDFSTLETQEAWEILINHKGFISDFTKFLEGTILNQRKSKAKEDKKWKEEQKEEKKQSENSRKNTSVSDTLAPPLPTRKWEDLSPLEKKSASGGTMKKPVWYS